MTKKKPEKVPPKRSARKKFDIAIDPEVEAWSKKLFHPIKPLIEGMKGNKPEADILSESDFSSDSLSLDTFIIQEDSFSSLSEITVPDNLSDTDFNADSDIKSVSDKLSALTEPKADLLVRSHDQEIGRSVTDKLAEPEYQAVQSRIESETDPMSEGEKKTAQMQLPFIKGELRIPNYIVKGLLATLSSTEFVVYLWLYFLSYGFGKNSCYISAGKLAAAVNLTERTVFRTLNSLESRGLVRRANRHFLGKAGGITFEIFLPETDKMSDTDLRSVENRSGSDILSDNKDHDHDPKRKTDHERRTIALYQDLTANPWTPADDLQYLQIKDQPIETIEQNMRVIATRAAETIRSFAYFAKSLKSLRLTQPRNERLLRMQEMIKEVRALYTGGRISYADLEEAVRARCEASGVTFDKALFNELASRR